MRYAEKGVVYLWALFAVTVAGVVLAGTGQIWQTVAQREKEKELLFIGEQYRKAIMSYYNNPLTGVKQYPEKLEDLLEDKRGAAPIRHLRKIYIDPMTLTDEWGVIEEEPPAASAQNRGQNAGLGGATAASISGRKGIAGVFSLSGKKPLKKENFPEHYASFSEAETYQDWHFTYTQQSGGGNAAGQGQQGTPGGAASPFGGASGAGGAARPGQGGLGAQGNQGGATSVMQPPASAQNPFAR